MRGLLAIGGKADPDAATIALAARLPGAPGGKVELLAHEPEARLIIAAVVMLASDIVVRHGGSRDEILMPDFPRIAADRTRDRVHHQLHCKAHARARHSAVWQEAGLVGRDAMGSAAVAAKIVRPRQVAYGLPRLQRNRERPVGIGAAVDGDLGIERL